MGSERHSAITIVSLEQPSRTCAHDTLPGYQPQGMPESCSGARRCAWVCVRTQSQNVESEEIATFGVGSATTAEG
eukprot:79836-Prymnesium_polylepis.1